MTIQELERIVGRWATQHQRAPDAQLTVRLRDGEVTLTTTDERVYELVAPAEDA